MVLSRKKALAVAGVVLFVASSLIGSLLLGTDHLEYFLTLRPFRTSSVVADVSPSRFDSLFPIGDMKFHDFWPDVNNQHMRALIQCLEHDNCGVNQTKIVIFASWDFTFAIQGHVSGENIWANSIMNSLDELGYTYFFAFNSDHLAERYRMFPDLVKVVIAQAHLVHECRASSECIKSVHNIHGVPLWKLFTFEYWKDSYAPHPLGKSWTLSPANYSNGNLFLGYSVNRTCSLQPYIPPGQRKNQTFVLAKRLSYFFKDRYPWTSIDFAHPPASVINYTFVASVWNDTQHEPEHDVPPSPRLPNGIVNLDENNLPAEEFYRELSHSKLLLGIGSPPLSPSPYDALCLGVPFLNPVWQWDEHNPEDRNKWATQHDGVKFIPEPYVYHVRTERDLGLRARLFWKAVERAVTTPIGRFVPAEMTPDAVTSRVSAFVEANWRSRAEQLAEESRRKGERPIAFTL